MTGPGSMRRLPALLLGLLLGLAAPASAADDGGTRSAFTGNAGARGAALGNAFVALSDDASGPLWNPAGLGFLARQEFQASRVDLFGSGLSEMFLGAALPSWRWGVFGLTYHHFGVSGIEGRDDRNVITDPNLSNAEDQIGLSYARQFGEAWSLGATVKLRRQSLAGLDASGLGADIGLQLRPGLILANGPEWLQETRLGFSLQNAVSPTLRLDRDDVSDPLVLRLGVAQGVAMGGSRRLLAAFDLERSPDMDARLHAGAELQLHPAFSVRAGLDNGTLTAGTSLRWHDLALTYSRGDHDLGAVQSLGISFNFGASVDERRQAAIENDERRLQERLADAFEQRQQERTATLMAAAEKSVAERNYEDALQSLGVLNTLSPGHPRALALEGLCWRNRAAGLEADGAWTEASLMYARALEVAADDSLAARGLHRARLEGDRLAVRTARLREQFAAGLDAFTKGELSTARTRFSAILADEPGDVEAARMLERTREAVTRRSADLLAQADQLARGGQFDQAGARLAQLRALDAGAPGLVRAEAELNRARAAAEDVARANTSPARRETTDAAKTPPGAVAAGTAEASGKPVLSPQRRREIEDLYQRGQSAVREGRTDDALRYWELVYAADPGHAQVRDYLKRDYLMRGMDSYAAGQLNEAVNFWQKALRLDPNDKKAAGYLARAQQQLARSREILGGSR